MKFIILAGSILVSLFFTVEVLAAQPSQGDRYEDGSIFLYREPVEMYWNDWTGVRLPKGKAYISGSGKTATFEGIIQMNCESGSGYVWLAATGSYNRLGISEAELNKTVPIQAISAAFTEFCEKF